MRILRQAEAFALSMAYWVADGTEPVHHIPTAEVLTYRQFDPRKPPELPDKMRTRKPDDWALTGEEGWHLDRPSPADEDDEEDSRPSLTESIRSEGMRDPVEILTDGQRAFMGDGTHRSTVAHELGHSHVPAHVVHMSPEDLDFHANEAYFMRGKQLPSVGSGVKGAL